MNKKFAITKWEEIEIEVSDGRDFGYGFFCECKQLHLIARGDTEADAIKNFLTKAEEKGHELDGMTFWYDYYSASKAE